MHFKLADGQVVDFGKSAQITKLSSSIFCCLNLQTSLRQCAGHASPSKDRLEKRQTQKAPTITASLIKMSGGDLKYDVAIMPLILFKSRLLFSLSTVTQGRRSLIVSASLTRPGDPFASRPSQTPLISQTLPCVS